MKTLVTKRQSAPKTQMGRFATLEEASQYKTNLVNKMLAKIKNLDEVLN
jgi:uncharacterized protein YqcC (DUF446 family)